MVIRESQDALAITEFTLSFYFKLEGYILVVFKDFLFKFNMIVGICIWCFKICSPGAGKIAYWVKAPATKINDLSLIPGTHKAEGKNQLLQLSFDFHMHTASSHPLSRMLPHPSSCTLSYTHTHAHFPTPTLIHTCIKGKCNLK